MFDKIALLVDTPERPQNITALDIQSRSLQLTWVEPHDNNAPIQGYLVLYNQPDFAGGMMMVLNVMETLANVTELYPGVRYNFTVLAFNEVGNSSSSIITQFRTLEEGKSWLCSLMIHWYITLSISSFELSTEFECLCEFIDESTSFLGRGSRCR